MKILLYIIAGCLLIGPILAWTYLIALGCVYKTSSSSRNIRLQDYLDTEFLTLAALPWVLGLVCLFAAARKRTS